MTRYPPANRRKLMFITTILVFIGGLYVLTHFRPVEAMRNSDFAVYLPVVWQRLEGTQPTPTQTPPPPTDFKPEDGAWSGTTSRNHPVSYNVTDSGTQVRYFKLKTDFDFGWCSGTTETTFSGPFEIQNNQFGNGGGTLSFTGEFTSSTTAVGTYKYEHYYIFGCNDYLDQEGTWTASIP